MISVYVITIWWFNGELQNIEFNLNKKYGQPMPFNLGVNSEKFANITATLDVAVTS